MIKPWNYNVLVTGATGFIGRRVVRLLEEAGTGVTVCAASTGHDLCEPGVLDQFRELPITHAINLAGRTFVPESWANPGTFYRCNTLATQQVLDFCREKRARLVHVSAYIYGAPKTLPIPETHPVVPNNPYAHSKWLAEELCRFYADHFGVAVTVLRPFNVFGPGQSEQFLIPTILRQARSGEAITVNDASPRRDYLHVDDFARACLKALDHPAGYALFNVGSGRSVSVAEVLELVKLHAPHHPEWRESGQVRVNEILDTVADISAITAQLDWQPRIGLEDFIASELS